MSAFKECFLFLRNPRGGVEDLDKMQAAGFRGVFCNIGDHTPAEWETVVRPRALERGMFCGPWARTQGSDGGFSEQILAAIIQCAMRWQSPLVVNSEAELKGTGDRWTKEIVAACEGFDAALSVEPWPFDNVEWWPLGDKMPVLPQVFGDLGFFDPISVRDQWWAYGVNCCFPTFGTYGAVAPTQYPLTAPYSLYTADDCGTNYAAWKPTGSGYVGCQQTVAPPTPEDDMGVIGNADGIAATFNRLRDLDPLGTLLQKQGNKWPSIETLEQPVEEWKAYDKAQRSLQILVDDHDAALGHQRSGEDDDG